MIIINETVEDWAAKYGIIIKPLDCPACKKVLKLSTPIAFKGYRGLQAEDCSCGNKNAPFVVVPIGADTKAIWNKLKDIVK